MLYAIGDFHLSFQTDKPMDIFGEAWTDHVNRLREGFSRLSPEDVCVICGDLTWGMSLESCLHDFRFIDELPGKKIILKGNHDFWWSTASKAEAFFTKNGINTIKILNNNCYFFGGAAICGTRGWFYDPERDSEHDRKIMAREIIRLETSLKAAGGIRPIHVFMHYPPRFGKYVCREITELFNVYGVTDCWYGHLHGPGHRFAVTGAVDGVNYHLVSADYTGFVPVMVM